MKCKREGCDTKWNATVSPMGNKVMESYCSQRCSDLHAVEQERDRAMATLNAQREIADVVRKERTELASRLAEVALERDRLRGELEEARRTIDNCRGYLVHMSWCSMDPCKCGLDTALAGETEYKCCDTLRADNARLRELLGRIRHNRVEYENVGVCSRCAEEGRETPWHGPHKQLLDADLDALLAEVES